MTTFICPTTTFLRQLQREGEYDYGDPEELAEWDKETIGKAGIDVCAYYYASGDYEGHGDMVFRLNGRWGHHNLGHCSCYGPVEDDGDFEREARHASLDELLAACSDELRKILTPLVEMCRAETQKVITN